MKLTDSVRCLSGIGEKTQKYFEKLDIFTVRDILYHLPVSYKDFRKITEISAVPFGEYGFFEVCVCGDVRFARLKGALTKTTFTVSDDSGYAAVLVFNQIYIKNWLKEGKTLYIYGKMMRSTNGVPTITSPEIYFSRPSELLPVYRLTSGVTQSIVRKAIRDAINNADIPEPYSDEFLDKYSLAPLRESLVNLHEPTDTNALAASRRRLVFDEFMIFNCVIAAGDSGTSVKSDTVFDVTDLEGDFLGRLPFSPTAAQIKVMREIASDMSSDRYMNRLVQGDVGCGKTIVAFFAMFCAYANGYQSVLMAPTELLSMQHYRQVRGYFPENQVVLLTGSMTAAKRRTAVEKIESGEAKVIIGTHALVCSDIGYDSLGLIITDEQHKFGVKQRARLAGGRDVHTLIMSATPIPRSLTLVLYGKSDISVIDELPPGRKPVKSYIVPFSKYDGMLGFLERQMSEGSQVYIVCPLIEENDALIAKAAKNAAEEFKSRFLHYNIELLHGKLKSGEKAEIMKRFASGETDMLVSTTVIEVGMDVPNATVMCVLNSERFGLAQLHQLRGRIGRGGKEAYCFFVTSNKNAADRLKILADTSDGFEIAKKDMELRGSGDILGTRQHGMALFETADIIRDFPVLEETRNIIEEIIKTGIFQKELEVIRDDAEIKLKNGMVDIAMN